MNESTRSVPFSQAGQSEAATLSQEQVVALLVTAPLIGAIGWSMYQLRVKAVHLHGDYRPIYLLLGIALICFASLVVVLVLD